MQSVQAQAGDGSGGACGAEEWFLTLITGTIITTDCKTAQEVADDWNETDADQTRTQIHSQAGQLDAGNEQYLTGMSNALTDSNTIAFSKGEAAAVEVLANGGTVSEAKSAANESIENYYTTKELNLIDRWNVNVQTVKTLYQRANNTSGVSSDFVTVGKNGNPDGGAHDPVELAKDGFSTTSHTVNNGTSAQVDTLGVTYSGSENTPAGVYYGYWTTSVNEWMTLNDDSAAGDQVIVRPTDNLTSKVVVPGHEFRNTSQQIDQRSEQTKKEVAVYIEESLAPAVENGELNATSYVSPATLAQEYAQEYNDSNSYIRATAIAAYSGMDAPNLSETGSMTVTHDGTTYEGLLLSQEAPSGGWESGETYDPALLSGIQMFALAGENSSIVELDGPFTVESIQGTDGEEIQTATTYNVTYETANTSEDYAELQEEIRTLNEQIEERQAQATGGGSDTTTNTGLLDQLAAALGVSVGAAVAVIAAAALLAARFYLQ